MSEIVREYNENVSLPPVRLDIVDLRPLMEIMRDNFPPDSVEVISIDEDRTETKYQTLAALETDTTLPDIVRNIWIRIVTNYRAVSTLSVSFRASAHFFGASISITGTDETVVLGKKARLLAFFQARKVRPSPIRVFFQSTWKFFFFYVAPANVIVQVLAWTNHTVAEAAFAVAAIAFGIYGLRIPETPSFELTVRKRQDGEGRPLERFRIAEVLLLLLTAISLVVLVGAWLFPRAPH